jgi:hypothetical protein
MGNVSLLNDNIMLGLKSFSGAATYAQCLPSGGGTSSIALPQVALAGVTDVTVKATYRTPLNGGMHYGPWVCLYVDNVFFDAAYIACSAGTEWQEESVHFLVPAGSASLKVQLRLQGSTSGYVDWDTVTVTGQAGILYSTDFKAGFDVCTTSGNVVLQPLAGATPPLVSFAKWQANGHDAGSVMSDPLFVNAGARDLRLSAGSPALAKGFTETNLADVGLYGDAGWKNLPANTPHAPVVPAPGPGGFTWTYEDETVGTAPVHSGAMSSMDASNYVQVAGDGGGQHLKFTGNPYVHYPVGVTDGPLHFTMDIKLPAATPSAVYVQFRDYANPGANFYRSGPYIYINSSRVLSAPGMENVTLPADTWVSLDFAFILGEGAAKTYTLTVTPHGQAPTVRTNVYFQNMDFKTLTDLYIVSTGGGAFLVDDVSLLTE